jgi:hypothetical protein
LSLPIHTLTKETYEDLLGDTHAKEHELEFTKANDTTQMYRDDLQELRKALLKSY